MNANSDSKENLLPAMVIEPSEDGVVKYQDAVDKKCRLLVFAHPVLTVGRSIVWSLGPGSKAGTIGKIDIVELKDYYEGVNYASSNFSGDTVVTQYSVYEGFNVDKDKDAPVARSERGEYTVFRDPVSKS